MAEPLSERSFAPFGRVVDAPAREPDSVGDPWRWWADTALLQRIDARYGIGYLEVDVHERAFDWAERHHLSEELVVPVRGELLLYVARPTGGDEPDRESFHVFVLGPGQAVILATGVWHGAPLAVEGGATALVLLREGTGATDTDLVRFEAVPVEVAS